MQTKPYPRALCGGMNSKQPKFSDEDFEPCSATIARSMGTLRRSVLLMPNVAAVQAHITAETALRSKKQDVLIVGKSMLPGTKSVLSE
ncbi:hypothetical protein K3495_g7362 [Podosphaera aphanis]|nr:hypothetical protein K3495_g7362 [Podosphaera aphanis]